MATSYEIDYYGSCDPLKEGNEGIWFEEEDPESEYYRPECCTNVYIDLASGKLEKLFKDWDIQEEYDADAEYEEEYQYEEENMQYDEVYEFDGNEFVEIDLNA